MFIYSFMPPVCQDSMYKFVRKAEKVIDARLGLITTASVILSHATKSVFFILEKLGR